MRSGRGFTLVEAFVAFALLFVALVFVFTMFADTRKGIHLTETHVNAVLLGQSLLNYAREASLVQWQDEDLYTVLPSISKTAVYKGIDNGAAYAQLIHYQVSASPMSFNNQGTQQERVMATMSWDEPGENAAPGQRLVLETVVTNLYNP